MNPQPCPKHKGDMMNGKTAELKLKEVCEKIFKDMVQKNIELGEKSYGFHFTYSPEESWKPTTRVLLLTTNPQSWDANEQRHKPIIPSTVWPKYNDFLRLDKNFPINEDILLLLAELDRDKKVAGLEMSIKNKTLKKNNDFRTFVDSTAVLASFVPFRTPGSGPKDMPLEMKKFAKEKYWNKIFEVWQPELIIAIGGKPFDGVQAIFKKMLHQNPMPKKKRGSDYPVEGTKTTCSEVYKSCDYTFPLTAEYPSGKTVHLVGLPHPSMKFGWMGYPTKTIKESAPVLQYLREKLKEINF